MREIAVGGLRSGPCAEGCPSCVGPRDPEEEVGLNPKAGLSQLLKGWLAKP